LSTKLSLVVAISMLLTPILFIVYDKFFHSRITEQDNKASDEIEETGTVIIAGAGRFGQIVNRLLVSCGIKTVVLDHDAQIVDTLGKFGVKGYFGDASRPELLEAAGIESARAIVIAIDDKERSVELVKYIRRHFPQVKTLARAFDVTHLYVLKKAGADVAVREMFEGSLKLGKSVLTEMGLHPFKVEKMSREFRNHDLEGLTKLYELWDENTEFSKNKAYLARAREHGETLKELMQSDRMQSHDQSERAWTPPPKQERK